MSFIAGLTKCAFFGFGFKKKEPEVKITSRHVKKILPDFKKAEPARKKYLAGKMSQEEYYTHAMPFMSRVAEVESESGIPNERLYKHMYDHHSK